MVGGGRDAFIGGVHRMAMRLDGKIELVAGAFSSNPEKAKLSGEDLLLDAQRVYADYRTMAAEESRLPSGERIDFVSVVTPNRTHVPVAKTFLEAGINVVCDKPLAFNLEEARALRDVVRRTGKLFALTHNYTGYPMVKEARELVRNGELGEILPSGHPEAFLEAFANIYLEVARAIEAEVKGQPVLPIVISRRSMMGWKGWPSSRPRSKAQEPAASGRKWSRSKKQSWVRRIKT
jgi:Oxidoreductase family, NAD-binding Rossmann fold